MIETPIQNEQKTKQISDKVVHESLKMFITCFFCWDTLIKKDQKWPKYMMRGNDKNHFQLVPLRENAYYCEMIFIRFENEKFLPFFLTLQ